MNAELTGILPSLVPTANKQRKHNQEITEVKGVNGISPHSVFENGQIIPNSASII